MIPLHYADGHHRATQGRRRRRNIWTIHAPDQTPHEGRPLCRPCRVRPVEEGRRRHGIPLRCKWTTGPKQLQGGRVLHRERPAREDEPNTDIHTFQDGVLTVSYTLMHLHSLAACSIFSRHNTIEVTAMRVHWDDGETMKYKTKGG